MDANEVISTLKKRFAYDEKTYFIRFNKKQISEEEDLKQWYIELKELLSKKNKLNKKISIVLPNYSRELLINSSLLNDINNKIDLKIYSEEKYYSIKEFIEENALLDNLIHPIKESDLSNYEKFLATYNIVKQYKPYMESPYSNEESRYLRHVLKSEYIVCVGYVNLLKELLDKINIKSIEMNVKTELGIEENATSLRYMGHSRLLVNIKDDKYNIDGIYVSDPTWDNDIVSDLYVHSLMTFSDTEIENRMFKLSKLDLLLGAKDYDDYNNRINYLINKYTNDLEQHMVYKTLIIKDILDLIYYIDPIESEKLRRKYNDLIVKLEKEIDVQYSEISSFLSDFGNYVTSKSNKPISYKTVVASATEVKRKINGYDQLKIIEWLNDVKKDNYYYLYEKIPYEHNYDINQGLTNRKK